MMTAWTGVKYGVIPSLGQARASAASIYQEGGKTFGDGSESGDWAIDAIDAQKTGKGFDDIDGDGGSWRVMGLWRVGAVRIENCKSQRAKGLGSEAASLGDFMQLMRRRRGRGFDDIDDGGGERWRG